MKPITVFWCAVAGLGAVLLLGQLFAAYPDLRGGALRLAGLLALGLIGLAAFDAVMLRKRKPGHTRSDLVYSMLPTVGLSVLLILLLALGGI